MKLDDIRDINQLLTNLDEPIRSPQQRRRNAKLEAVLIDKYDPNVQIAPRRKSVRRLAVETSYALSGALVGGGLGVFLLGTEWGSVDNTVLGLTAIVLVVGGAIAGRQIGLRSLGANKKK